MTGIVGILIFNNCLKFIIPKAVEMSGPDIEY